MLTHFFVFYFIIMPCVAGLFFQRRLWISLCIHYYHQVSGFHNTCYTGSHVNCERGWFTVIAFCSLVSGIEMGIGKTRLSLPHFSMSSSMVFLIYDVPKIVASAKKLQLPSPPCLLSNPYSKCLFANVINKWSPTGAHQSPIIDGLRLNLCVCRSCNRMQPRKWSIF